VGQAIRAKVGTPYLSDLPPQSPCPELVAAENAVRNERLGPLELRPAEDLEVLDGIGDDIARSSPSGEKSAPQRVCRGAVSGRKPTHLSDARPVTRAATGAGCVPLAGRKEV
jgi:hypothetical protein